jgi:enoyl-CoA hydratase/carnithine racemase
MAMTERRNVEFAVEGGATLCGWLFVPGGASAGFGHPEQSIAIVTLLGGIYRIAERAGRSRAIEWALTSEQVPATVMERYGVVNRVVEDNALFARHGKSC